MGQSSIVWVRLDRPGHESARLIEDSASQLLAGSAVFTEAHQPVRLDYRVTCDALWRTQRASVQGWVGPTEVAVEIAVTPDGEWFLGGAAVPSVTGCTDIDLNFSPSTNLLPIRRLSLAIGEEAAVRAAWLRFPSFNLEILEQTYRRLGSRLYQYASAGFSARLEVNDAGFPAIYGDVWRAEATS
ncbi:MAG TPA: putative glycolipid-binding domain-containing protein [Thermoanaerobaculia bacterium]|nr:putative glycolipid-binding domain-containing protein [Thermoanaerobaculia bacterium]